MTSPVAFGARIAAIAAIAGTSLLAVAPSALAQDGDTQYGQRSTMQDWVDQDGAADIRLNAQIDGGESNSVSALIQAEPDGQTLASFIGGPHVGVPAHSYVQTNWVYVGLNNPVYIVVAGGAAGVAQNGGYSDALSSGYWTTWSGIPNGY